ncbi:MAG: DegT/DnrJ/EryC1/StrS family aminotransferase [Opitutaceae bacterium]
MPAPALRPRPVPGLGFQAIGAEEEALVLDVLRRKELFRYYGNDAAHPPPMAAQLEKEFRAYIATDCALAVTSGSAALEVAMAACGIGPGDEVIVNAWSWISCFTAIVRVGARPVLAEIDDSLNLDPKEIARLTTPHTRAVIVVHYQGVAAALEEILLAAHKRGIYVIEDCAQSLGTRYRGRQVGAWGDIATFSFQNNKVATSGEGGMVVTRDQRLYERAVRFHDLGNYRPYHAALVPATEPAFAGGQFRMSELTAAVALAQLRKVDKIREHCRALSARILPRIAELKGVTLRREPDPAGSFGFEPYFFLDRAEQVTPFREKLDALNVNCGQRTGTYPQYGRDYVKTGRAHTVAASPFREFKNWPAPGYRAEDFPRTEDLTKRFIALPLGWLYTTADADYIADSVIAVHREVCR